MLLENYHLNFVENTGINTQAISQTAQAVSSTNNNTSNNSNCDSETQDILTRFNNLTIQSNNNIDNVISGRRVYGLLEEKNQATNPIKNKNISAENSSSNDSSSNIGQKIKCSNIN